VYVFNACDECHGPDGFAQNASNAPDLNSPEIWNQTDGAIFWKIKSRKHGMPGSKKLSKVDVWNLTNYLRSEYDN
jgi:mono/diheme cytochrome c family protein